MIQVQTILNVTDNSGAREAMCIKVLGSSKRRYASLGDVIIVSIKKAVTKGIVKKKAVERAIVVRVKKEVARKDGSLIKFDDNAVVIVGKDLQPKGTRVFGPIAREVKTSDETQKIISLAQEVL